MLVDSHLDRQQQVRCALDLIDYDGRLESGDESRRIIDRGFARRLVIEREHHRWTIGGRDLLHKRALAHLSSSQDHDDAGVVESFKDEGAETTFDHHAGNHGVPADLQFVSRQICRVSLG